MKVDPSSGRAIDDWNEHWAAHAVVNALNPAQIYRTKLVLEALALGEANAPLRVLELGSGTGEFAGHVLGLRPDAEFVGLDLSAVGVEISQRKVPAARFFQQDFMQPIQLAPSYRGWATHVVCSEVLEHLDDPAGMLRNMRPLLAPGCRVIVTVPAGPMSAFDRHIGHRRHFNPTLLEETLRAAGLNVLDLRGAGFPFFNLYRLAVVARGKKLIEDTAGTSESALPIVARGAMHTFSWLFKLNTTRTRLGWQLVAVGVEP
ncbi:MAG TPA: class I SAM-dependent methyltransferase [Polyangiaceae bacterium]|jgi:SAM-dependent methyltransferase|nr:class I SAM-dependent methyltransferase [Polyangiaceae bacterium]